MLTIINAEKFVMSDKYANFASDLETNKTDRDMKVFVIYEGDQWLSTDSLRVKAVCNTFEDVVRLVRENNHVDVEEALDTPIEADDAEDARNEVADLLEQELKEYMQTTLGDVRYMVDEVELNEWI